MRKGVWLKLVSVVLLFLLSAIPVNAQKTETSNKKYDLYLDLYFEEGPFGTNDNSYSVYLNDEKLGDASIGRYFTHLSEEMDSGDYTIKVVSNTNSKHEASYKVTLNQSMTSQATIVSKLWSTKVSSSKTIEGTGGAHLVVPDLTKATYANARKMLDETGFVNYSYKTQNGKGIKNGDNWVVTTQSIKTGSEADKNAELLLECISTTAYFKEELKGKSFNAVDGVVGEYGYSKITYTSAITGNDITDRVNDSKEEWNLWNVKKVLSVDTDSKSIEIQGKFNGERRVPNLVYADALEAKNRLNESDFSKISFKDLDGNEITEERMSEFFVCDQKVDAETLVPVSKRIKLTAREYSGYFGEFLELPILNLETVTPNFDLSINYRRLIDGKNISSELGSLPNEEKEKWIVKEIKKDGIRLNVDVLYLGDAQIPDVIKSGSQEAIGLLRDLNISNINIIDPNLQNLSSYGDGLVIGISPNAGSIVNCTDEVTVCIYTFTALSKTMYSTGTLNVRDLPSKDGAKLGIVEQNTALSITGQCNQTGWYRVKYDNKAGYVSADYVSEEQIIQNNPGVRSSSNSNDDSTGITVYITNTGTKYHNSGCSSLRRSKTPISLTRAKELGYEPCGRCHPPR